MIKKEFLPMGLGDMKKEKKDYSQLRLRELLIRSDPRTFGKLRLEFLALQC